VLVADDHAILREALRSLLEKEGCEVVGQASNSSEALALATRLNPEVILMDIELQKSNGLAAARQIAKVCPTSRIVILSAHDDEQYVLDALSDELAAGYVVKTDVVDELVPAVRAVAMGGRYISLSVASSALTWLKRPPSSPAANMFTPRELEVLRLIARGATSRGIAQRLQIDIKTARKYRNNLKQKLDLGTTAEIVRYASKYKSARDD
jgi:DNA-binding NarL/FixJ family response regulator